MPITRIGSIAPSSVMMSKPLGADERVETAGAELTHLVFERGHPPRGEDTRHQAAVHRVDGRVLEEDHTGR